MHQQRTVQCGAHSSNRMEVHQQRTVQCGAHSSNRMEVHQQRTLQCGVTFSQHQSAFITVGDENLHSLYQNTDALPLHRCGRLYKTSHRILFKIIFDLHRTLWLLSKEIPLANVYWIPSANVYWIPSTNVYWIPSNTRYFIFSFFINTSFFYSIISSFY